MSSSITKLSGPSPKHSYSNPSNPPGASNHQAKQSIRVSYRDSSKVQRKTAGNWISSGKSTKQFLNDRQQKIRLRFDDSNNSQITPYRAYDDDRQTTEYIDAQAGVYPDENTRYSDTEQRVRSYQSGTAAHMTSYTSVGRRGGGPNKNLPTSREVYKKIPGRNNVDPREYERLRENYKRRIDDDLTR